MCMSENSRPDLNIVHIMIAPLEISRLVHLRLSNRQTDQQPS